MSSPSRWRRGHAGLAKIRKKWGPHWYTVTETGYATPCFIWNGSKSKPWGYGRTRWKGRTIGAHVRAWIESGRQLVNGKVLDHLCGQTACVNPEHLELVTPTVNARRSRATKLTEAIVAEIRARYTGTYGEQSALAREYGVQPGTIRFILSGQTWKE